MQSTYAESIAGYSSFMHDSDHPPPLGLKSHLVQKGKNRRRGSCLAFPDRQTASDRARTGGRIANWEMGAQRQQDGILAKGRLSLL